MKCLLMNPGSATRHSIKTATFAPISIHTALSGDSIQYALPKTPKTQNDETTTAIPK